MAVAKAHEAMGFVSGRRKRPACILIHGADRGGVFDLCRQLAEKVTDGSNELDVIRLQDAQKDRLYTEVFSLSMFGGTQVVWLSASGDSVAAILEPVLASQESGSLIIIDSDALTKSSKLRKLCEADPRAVSIAIYEESAAELRGRLSARIKDAGANIADEALDRLVDVVARERAAANGEVDKLVLYARGQNLIGVEDVEAVCGDGHEASLDDMMDAVFDGSMVDVDRFGAMIEQAGSRNALSVALAAVGKLQSMAVQVAHGQSPDGVAKALANAVFFKRQARVSKQLRLWSLRGLLEAEEKIGAAILQTRQNRKLESAITSRTLLAVSWLARSQAA
jgi:DNA polymerase III subunit delta